MLRRNTYLPIVAITLLLACPASVAKAQMPSDAMGIPIPTTIVLAKPTPGETYQGRLLITVGVGSTIYKFILKDGYTNHIYVKWASIWEQVRQSSPNLVAAGLDAEKFSQVEPGGTVTISGMYTPEQRNFEIMTVELGEGRFQNDQRR
ncbi:MAG TPA: hypothetical protein VN742_08835, partial [Candidatus Binataceae bacterium]|nr:hypothetical protein [Candidatus Binataceae bacterium]